MRQRVRVLSIFAAVLFLISFAPSYAKDLNPQKTSQNINDILDDFPADDPKDAEHLVSQMTGFGKDGIVKLCLYLESPNQELRTKAEYAVHGLTVYSAGDAEEEDRLLVSKSFLKALKDLNSRESKKFIISQLQLVGKKEAVRPISHYLTDKNLCEPAAGALLAIGTKRAEKALIKSLDSVTGDRRITVIKTLGKLQSRKAVKKIKPFAFSENRDLRRVALYALANSGDPSCLSILGTMRIRSSAYERSKAPLLYLLYIRRLAESGPKELSLNICRELIANYSSGDEIQIQCSALDLIVDLAGKEALNDLLSAVESQNKELRRKALDLALDIYSEEMSPKWVEKMEGKSAEREAEILTMLGKTGDRTLQPVFQRKLNSQSLALREAAVSGLSRLGKEKIVQDLFKLLTNNVDEEIQFVKKALLGVNAELVIPLIKKEFEKMPLNARIALIEIISDKQALDCADLVFSQAEDKDEKLRLAALSALENISDDDDISDLIRLLKSTDKKKEISLLQNALVSASQFVEDPEKRAEKICHALDEAKDRDKIVFLRVLSEIGGTKALEAVLEAQKSENREISTEAFYTLAAWKKFEAADELLILSQRAIDKKHRYLGLKSYFRLIGDSDLEDEEKFKMLLKAKEILQETEEKRLYLSALGEIKTLGALREAAVFLDFEDLKQMAADKMAKIALPDPLREGLTGSEAAFLLQKAVVFIDDEYERERISDYIEKMSDIK